MSDPIENQPPDFESGGFSQSSLSDLPSEIAILPLRDTVLFPEAVLPLAVARDASVTLVNDAVRQQRTIGVLTQKEAAVDDPVEADLFAIGTLTHIHKMFKFPDGTLRLVVQGVGRFKVLEITQYRPYIKARIEVLKDTDSADKQIEVKALAQAALSMFQKAVDLTPNLPDELKNMAARTTNPSHLADFIASSLPSLTSAERQELLEVLSVHERLERVNRLLAKDLEVLEVGSKIQNQVKTELQKNQREYYLREQMKAIQKELGDGDDQQREISELREKIEKAEMTEEAKKEALRELDRLTRMPQAAAEYTVTRTYIDWLVSLPWNKRTEVELDIQKAKDVLDADHYGLEKVKDRILEYLAVKKMKPDVKGPILCFVGPPGVGKTSLGKSIASAMGRKFHRMSFGGMRDEGRGFLPESISNLSELKGEINKFQTHVVLNDTKGAKASESPDLIEKEPELAFYDKLTTKKDDARSSIQSETVPEAPKPIPAPPSETVEARPSTSDKKVTAPPAVSDKKMAASSPDVPATKIGSGKYTIQVASIAGLSAAQKAVKQLVDKGFDAYYYETKVKGKTYYRIRCGKFQDRAEAVKTALKLQEKTGYKGYVTGSE